MLGLASLPAASSSLLLILEAVFNLTIAVATDDSCTPPTRA
jgi:hypothetical protein